MSNKNKNDNGAEINVPSTQSNNQRNTISSLYDRVESLKNKVRKDQASDPKSLEVRDIDGRRRARQNAADVRRATTQSKQLSRDANMAYREAIKRNDRAGAYAIKKDAISNGIDFGGIKRASSTEDSVLRSRANAQLGAEMQNDSALMSHTLHNQFMENNTAQMNANPYGFELQSNPSGLGGPRRVDNTIKNKSNSKSPNIPDTGSHDPAYRTVSEPSVKGKKVTSNRHRGRSSYLPRVAPFKLNFNRFA